MFLKINVSALILFVLLSLSLTAQKDSRCSDCTDYRTAVEYLNAAKEKSERISEQVITARMIALRYHRRRMDPDSILSAAYSLRQVSSKGSKAYAFAVFSIAESHLNLFEEEAYLTARSSLVVSEFSDSLGPLINFYLLALDAKYDHKISLNTERMTLILLNVIREVEKFHPEMLGELIVTLCEGYSHLGLLPMIMQQVKDYQARIKPKIKDELDAINYKHGMARIWQFSGKNQRAGNMQEELIDQLEQYQEELPAILANCYFYAGEACYRLHRDESCTPLFEKALQYKRSKDYSEMYVAALYYSQQYDQLLKECQRFLTEAITRFSPSDLLDLPSLEGEIMGGQYPGNLLMWKGRALYKKSIGMSDEAAIPLLENGLESAELGRILHNRILFGADGYNVSQMILNNQNTYGLGYQMRIAYQLWLRTRKHEHRKSFFRYMEMRKNYLLSDAFSLDYLPLSDQQKLTKATKEMEAYEYKFLQVNQDSIQYYMKIALTKSRELDRCFQEIRERHPRPIMDHAQLEYADPDVIQRELDDSTAFVIYTQQWQHYYVYVITSTNQRLVKIYKGKEGNDMIQDLIKSASSPLQMQRSRRDLFIDRSHKMYDLFVAPIAKDLEEKKRLILIPEEYIGQIPFEILVKNDDKKPYSALDFLIKDFEIAYHSSATFYNKIQARSEITNGNFLGFAPVFEEGGKISQQVRSSRMFMNRFYNGIKGKTFAALPGTEREVSTIADLLPDVTHPTILLRQDATSTRLAYELRKDYQYVHIATHGLMSLFDPRRSAFACYDSENLNGDFLFAHYIESLELHTDLAVLSSCESGIGIILEGENLIALSRSFLAAGAKNILYSLWKVDDQSSSDLMIDFYQRHLQGKRYATALREAKLKLLANPTTAGPRLWAPFVLMGE